MAEKNLFSTWYNAILSILGLLLIYWLVSGLIARSFTEALWTVLEANFRLFFAGL